MGYRINEIFLSLQGEGFHTGKAAVFVRFSGCNLRCAFCDTDFSSYRELSAEDIAAEVEQLSPSPETLLVLTGGEPSLQVDDYLLATLRQSGKTICIETNGTHTLPDGIDWITCSPKEDSRIVLTHADELKIVYTGQNIECQARQISARHLYLQPCSCANTKEVIDYILQHPQWRLSLQTQKYLNIR